MSISTNGVLGNLFVEMGTLFADVEFKYVQKTKEIEAMKHVIEKLEQNVEKLLDDNVKAKSEILKLKMENYLLKKMIGEKKN